MTVKGEMSRATSAILWYEGHQTDPDSPYIIEYSSAEAECEASDTLYRRLSVVFPRGEFFCNVNGARSCGATPLCTLPTLTRFGIFKGVHQSFFHLLYVLVETR